MNKILVLISLLIPIFSTLTAMEQQQSDDDGVASTQQESYTQICQRKMEAYLKRVNDPNKLTLQDLINRTPDEELRQIQQLLLNRNSHSKSGNK